MGFSPYLGIGCEGAWGGWGGALKGLAAYNLLEQLFTVGSSKIEVTSQRLLDQTYPPPLCACTALSEHRVDIEPLFWKKIWDRCFCSPEWKIGCL